MRKSVFLIFTAMVFTLNAQSNKIIGSWLMEKADVKGEIRHPYQVFEFRENGRFIGMDVDIGTWKYDKTGNNIILSSQMDEDFNGSAAVIKLKGDELVVDKDGTRFYYRRVYPEKIARVNEASKLAGKWKLTGTDYPFAVLKLDLPQDFTLIRSDAAETDQSGGTWIFHPGEKTFIFVGFSHLLRGRVPVSDLTAESFTLTLNDRIIKARRIKDTGKEIERLTFQEEDFPEDFQPDESRLPWRDNYAAARFLSKVASVRYTNGILVPELDMLKHTSVIFSKIQADSMQSKIKFTNFIVTGNDSSQFSENYRDEMMNSNNAFYPQNEPWPYRIKGVEKISVPAGNFDCTVIEAIDGDKKLKYWMINDKPGIYAKIIWEETDPFGELTYRVQELEEIGYKGK